ncbi:MAG: SurA N-terminal domain-containing protein [Oceanococcaceae bacterium]
MLQAIREKTSGPLAWAIVAIISVPFAFFGIEAFQSGGGSRFAVKVNGEEISRFEVDNRVEARYAQFRDMLGENFSPDMFNRAQLRSGVTEDLIQETVIRQFLAESGHRISDARVRDFVASQEAFQDAEGNFSPDIYRQSVTRQGESVQNYEDRVRVFLGSSQFENAIRESALVAPPELEAEWAWQEQQREIRWRRYRATAIADDIDVTDNEVLARYEETKSALMTPERVRIEYIELSLDALAAQVEVTEDDIQASYTANAERYAIPETRTARHILVEDEATAVNLRAQLEGGADFASLAEEYSQDPGSAAAGGDLGVISRGVMVPPFEDAVFSLDVDVVSAPVETQFGWHLIEVTGIEGGGQRSLDEVRDSIADSLRQTAARAQLTDLQDRLEQEAFENPSSLAPAAEALGLVVETSSWFTRDGGAGLTANPNVIQATFSPTVLEDGDNSPLVQANDSVVALRLAEREMPRQQELDEVRESLVAELTARKAAEQLTAWVEADRAAAEAGAEAWSTLPEREAMQSFEAGTFKRNSSSLERRVLQAAFNVDEAGEVAAVSLNNGDRALVQVLTITDGDWAQANDEDKKRLRQRLQQRVAGLEMQLLINALRADAKIVYSTANSEETDAL